MRTLTDFFDLSVLEVEDLFRNRCKGDIELVYKHRPKGDRDWKGFRKIMRLLKLRGCRQAIPSTKIRKKQNRYQVWMIWVAYGSRCSKDTLSITFCCADDKYVKLVFFIDSCKILEVEKADYKTYLAGADLDYSWSLKKFLS